MTTARRGAPGKARPLALLMALGLALLAAWPIPAVAQQTGLITNQLVLPDTVYLESTVQGPALNFDLAFRVAQPCAPVVAVFRYLAADGSAMLIRRLVNHQYNEIERFLTILDAEGNALPLTSQLAAGWVVTLTHPFSQIDWPGQMPALVEVDLYLSGAAGVEAYTWQVPVSQHAQSARLRLPFSGRWWHLEGHEAFSHHRHLPVRVNSNYFACDFMVVDDDYQIASSQGLELTDYYSYGQPILAAGAGNVALVVTGMPDNPPGGQDPFYETTAGAGEYGGNLVIIRHAPGEYSYYAHLQPGSIRVAEGQEVVLGQVIAACGNSGSSTSAPHLHFQLMSAPEKDFRAAVGLPAVFSELELQQGGSWLTMRQRSLLAGELVRHSEP